MLKGLSTHFATTNYALKELSLPFNDSGETSDRTSARTSLLGPNGSVRSYRKRKHVGKQSSNVMEEG